MIQPYHVALSQRPDSPSCREHFNALRAVSYEAARAELVQAYPQFGNHLKLSGLTPEVEAAWEDQWLPRLGGLSFDEMSEYYPHLFATALRPESLAHSPHRYEAALWHGETLCGMTVGSVSRTLVFQDNQVELAVTAASPDCDQPLRGLTGRFIYLAACHYARALGADTVSFRGPYSDRFRAFIKRGRADGFFPPVEGREALWQFTGSTLKIPVQSLASIHPA